MFDKLFGTRRVKKLLASESGAVLITVALCMFLLMGFLALSVEAGRWYLVRSELSKSVDAAALAGTKNISNPHVNPETVAEEFGQANFPSGFLYTPGSGKGSVTFDATLTDGNKVQVRGDTDALPILARLFGIQRVPVASVGAAQMQDVEIEMVLDRSGSMAGQPIADLKKAATTFVDYFKDTQARDKVGLVSFATSVKVDFALGSNFVTPMKTAINAMSAVGATNPGDAIFQAGGPKGLTDQSNLPPERRHPQFLIFFSDGRPTAFRGFFKYKNATVDAVACVTGNCDPGDGGVTYNLLGNPTAETWTSIDPRNTGDGVFPASKCGPNVVTTRWFAFDTYPVPGYAPTACSIPYQTKLHDQVCNLASMYALRNAQVLKNKGVTVYAIGIGTVNTQFLEALATSKDQVFFTPNSSELAAIFQQVAKEIKLRLVM